jgi:hypothetical protein
MHANRGADRRGGLICYTSRMRRAVGGVSVLGAVLGLSACSGGGSGQSGAAGAPSCETPVHQEQIGEEQSERAGNLATDASGRVVIGYTTAAPSSPQGPVTVVSRAPDGALLWERNVGTGLRALVGASEQGDVVAAAAGTIRGYDAADTERWQLVVPQLGVGALAVEPAGFTWVAAPLVAGIDFGDGLVTGPGPGLVVARIDAQGSVVFHASYAASESSSVQVFSAAADAEGVFLSGSVKGEVELGSVLLAGENMVFVARIGSDGSPRWATSVGPAGGSSRAHFSGSISSAHGGGAYVVRDYGGDTRVHALDQTGAPSWEHVLPHPWGTDASAVVATADNGDAIALGEWLAPQRRPALTRLSAQDGSALAEAVLCPSDDPDADNFTPYGVGVSAGNVAILGNIKFPREAPQSGYPNQDDLLVAIIGGDALSP